MINISGYIHADSHGFMIPIKAIVMWFNDIPTYLPRALRAGEVSPPLLLSTCLDPSWLRQDQQH